MKCTNCQACADNGGHCIHDDLDLAVTFKNKREMVLVDKEIYERIKQDVEDKEDRIRQLEAEIRFWTATR